MMIAYQLWYFTEGGNHLIQVAYPEVILQELLYIHREVSGLKWTKESSADRVDYSRRIRPCLPRISGK